MTRIEANSTLHFVQALRLEAFHAGRENHHDLFHAGAVHAQNAERIALDLDFGTREQFGATMPGRLITRMGLSTARFCDRLIPSAAKDFMAARYKPLPRVKGEVPPPPRLSEN